MIETNATADEVGSKTAEAGLLSIVIKAYNEERKIAAAIESALATAPEIAPLRLEVVLADSLSTDRTVELACQFPVRVVRLRHPQDRGCGAGVQLGYEWTRGEWVYLMDGDMRLAPGFLPAALRCMAQDPSVAGVGGRVEDERVINGFDRIRVNNRSGRRTGNQAWLEGGGLYRRLAIERAGGHAADRNLLAYEEAELGLRIGQAGYRLCRLDQQAVTHEGHALGTLALLQRHWRSRRAMSAGMLLRMALRRPWRWRVVRMLAHPLATGLWWLVLIAGPLVPGVAATFWLALWCGISLLAVVGLTLIKRDAAHALTSVASWHYALAAIAFGWFEPVRPTSATIDAELVQESLHSGIAPGP